MYSCYIKEKKELYEILFVDYNLILLVYCNNWFKVGNNILIDFIENFFIISIIYYKDIFLGE